MPTVVVVGHGVIRSRPTSQHHAPPPRAHPARPPAPARPDGTVPVVRSEVETATGYLASFADGDPDDIVAFVADGFVNEHLSELGSGSVGADEYRERLPGFLSTFAGARYTVLDVVGDGATVVVRYTFEATFDGTGIEIPGMMWFTVVDGEITTRTDLWDSLAFLRQTGQA